MKAIISSIILLFFFTFTAQSHALGKSPKIKSNFIECDYTVHEFSVSYSYSKGKTTVTVTYDIEITDCGDADGRFRGSNSWEYSTSSNGSKNLVGSPTIISGPSIVSNPGLHNFLETRTEQEINL